MKNLPGFDFSLKHRTCLAILMSCYNETVFLWIIKYISSTPQWIEHSSRELSAAT